MAVKAVDLRLGPLDLGELSARLSGVRWLRNDGDWCEAGDVFAYCNFALYEAGRTSQGAFAHEKRDLQVAFATPVAGRLKLDPSAAAGGFQNFLSTTRWRAHMQCAAVMVEEGEAEVPDHVEARVLLFAGRRTTEVAEVRSGLLTGWHSLSRASHVPAAGVPGTLLSMGVCEVEPVLKGESHAFLEFLAEAPGPAQVVFAQDRALVRCARVVAEQIVRTPQQAELIAASLRGLWQGDRVPTAATLLRAGALLDALMTSPATTPLDVLSRSGLARKSAPDAILMSAHAERCVLLRHRELGYTAAFHAYHLREADADFKEWIQREFKRIPRDLAQIERDYENLVDVLEQRLPGTQLLVTNAVSSSADEDIVNYAGVPTPLEENVRTVLAKDINLMLASLARRRGIAVVDVDALAAEEGVSRNFIDGVHHSGAMSSAIRREILAILRARRVPGFFPAH